MEGPCVRHRSEAVSSENCEKVKKMLRLNLPKVKLSEGHWEEGGMHVRGCKSNCSEGNFAIGSVYFK